MAQFNEKEHLQNVTLLAEELAKILKNSMIIVGKEFREIGDLTAMARDLMAGKRSPLLDMNPNEDSKKGKYLLTYDEQKPKLHFIERQEMLKIPAALKQYLTPEDVANMQKYGNVNRVIYVDSNGTATPKYVSLDKETNTITTMSTHKISINDKILGVALTLEQKDNLKAGNPILLKGLTSKDGGENWDAVVSVDAVSKGLSFKKVDLSIPREILGVELTAEQKTKIKAGESVLVNDMISKNTGNKFSAMVSLNDGHLDLKMVSDAPQKLLGVELSEEQRTKLRAGESVLVKGMTSKAGKSFDATISLSPEKGIVFDFNNQKQEVPVEKKQPESTLKIPLLDDSAYHGNLKRTPSIHPNLKGMVDDAVTNLKKSKELDKPIAKGRKAVVA
jgi:Protein of unknown function (DUF3945)